MTLKEFGKHTSEDEMLEKLLSLISAQAKRINILEQIVEDYLDADLEDYSV